VTLLTEVPTPAGGVQTAYLDGEAVLYDVARRRTMLLNPTASALWLLLDGESTVAEIRDTLVEIFGADPEVVRRDVEAGLTQFAEMGLLDGIVGHEGDETPESLVTTGALAAPPVP